MSTYLLAWVVSDFDGLVSETADANANVTTWGRKNLLSPRTAYLANMVAPLALDLLGEFTGIPYTLSKVDQYAIPDFDAGAMENWGLVTYRCGRLAAMACSICFGVPDSVFVVLFFR